MSSNNVNDKLTFDIKNKQKMSSISTDKLRQIQLCSIKIKDFNDKENKKKTFEEYKTNSLAKLRILSVLFLVETT